MRDAEKCVRSMMIEGCGCIRDLQYFCQNEISSDRFNFTLLRVLVQMRIISIQSWIQELIYIARVVDTLIPVSVTVADLKECESEKSWLK